MSSFSNNIQNYTSKEYIPKKIKKKYPQNISFQESIFIPQKIISILESSLDNQKYFIDFIFQNFESFPEVKSIKIINQIFNILPVIIKKLSLPFSSLLLDESSILEKFLEIFVNYSDFSVQITCIFQNIYNIFEPVEDLLISSPIAEWKNIFIEMDIIKEVNKKNLDDYALVSRLLSNFEVVYINLNNLYDNWVLERNMGNNIEEENLNHLNECLKMNEDELNSLKSDPSICQASLDFLEDLLNKIKEYKGEKYLNDYKYINNEFSLEDHINNNENNVIDTNNIYSIGNNFQNKKESIEEILTNLKKIPLNKRTFFYKNEKILEDENEYTEYKDYYFPFGDKQIKELQRQICGFINSNGGRLYIGITDQKIIKGIVLNYNSIRNFQNLLFSYIDNFNPNISDGKIKIFYIPIKKIENNSFINNLYIIKILIYPGDPTILYSISSNNFISSVRLQGQCANLTAEEIHKEIIERHKNKNMNKMKPFNEIDFNDPNPEKVEPIENYFEEYNDEDNLSNRYDYTCEGNDINPQLDSEDEISYNANRIRRRKKKKNKKKEGKKITLKIYNIDQGIPAVEIRNIFKDCGCISGQFFSKRNGYSSGFGYLQFKNENLANNCISKFNNKKIGNKVIKLKREIIK